jgi:hypothetical protein
MREPTTAIARACTALVLAACASPTIDLEPRADAGRPPITPDGGTTPRDAATADAQESDATERDAPETDSAWRADEDRYTGVITSFPLPATPDAPYSSVGSSKHTNMASDGTRLWVTGGDWLHSATDGTWSMDLADGSWRQEIGAPVHPTLPAPHALQDGAGFVWVASRARFLIWPGSYFAYESAGDPILDYARGMWWLDPATRTYEQELGLFGTYGHGSGNLYGGVYDEVNEEILVFDDDSGGLRVRRWDVASLTALPDLPLEIPRVSGHAAYFTQGMHAKIGRDVYIVGYRTSGERASQVPLFLVWNLDEHTVRELAPPPVPGADIAVIEIRMGVSHGKVVWPFTRGPEGEIRGIHVYDPALDRWLLDDQVPDYGSFIGNALTSLDDGRVVFSGGVFGRQQTHIWFYEAP